jgi:hypothetical protein
MENFSPEEVASSKEPPQTIPLPAQITPEDLERMKQQARDLAIAQYYSQQQAREYTPQVQLSTPVTKSTEPKVAYEINQPIQIPTKVVYVRRNLTIAELLVIFAVSCGLVYGIPAAWNFVSQNVPRIEIKMK